MATYTTAAFSDPPYSMPTAGVHQERVKHTLTAALSQSTSDVLKIKKVAKGMVIIPELCSVFAAADPDSGNNATLAMKLTDGTTTKTIIGAENFQAANTRIVPDAADIATLGFFQVDNDDYYIYLEPGANDIDSGAVLFVTFGVQAVGGRSESSS